jgi:hypothetical protein
MYLSSQENDESKHSYLRTCNFTFSLKFVYVCVNSTIANFFHCYTVHLDNIKIIFTNKFTFHETHRTLKCTVKISVCLLLILHIVNEFLQAYRVNCQF